MLYATLCAAAFACSAPVESANWPSFRGDGTSISSAKNLPLKWSATENIAWRNTLPGYGQSSPVVWGDRVFVTAIDGAEKEKLFLVALESKNGKVAWQKELASTLPGKNNQMMSRAGPTPVVDANGVYAFFESGDVHAFTHEGKALWTRSISKDYGKFENAHGLSSSPAQTQNAVIILIDDMSASYLLALDKKTGKTVWKTDRVKRSSWCSPVVANLNGKQRIIISSNGSLSVYDAESGKEIAMMEGLTGNNVASAVVVQDRIYLGAAENRMNPDIVASAKSNCCVKLVEKDGQAKLETVWQAKKAISSFASPLVVDGFVFIITKAGVVHCLDAKTGEEKYAERLPSSAWATPIAANGYIYFFCKDGSTAVVKSGSSFELVNTNRQGAPKEPEKTAIDSKGKPDAPAYPPLGVVVYGAAAVDGTIFIRTGTELLAIRK